MKIKDLSMAVIMLSALLGIVVLVTDARVGLSPKAFGAAAFGTILVFGFVNMALVVLDAIRNRSKDK